MDYKKDYYGTLGILPAASEDQIKSAYRRIAREFHPDVNKTKEAADRFNAATEAHDVLMDKTQRRQYDFARAKLGSKISLYPEVEQFAKKSNFVDAIRFCFRNLSPREASVEAFNLLEYLETKKELPALYDISSLRGETYEYVANAALNSAIKILDSWAQKMQSEHKYEEMVAFALKSSRLPADKRKELAKLGIEGLVASKDQTALERLERSTISDSVSREIVAHIRSYTAVIIPKQENLKDLIIPLDLSRFLENDNKKIIPIDFKYENFIMNDLSNKKNEIPKNQRGKRQFI